MTPNGLEPASFTQETVDKLLTMLPVRTLPSTTATHANAAKQLRARPSQIRLRPTACSADAPRRAPAVCSDPPAAGGHLLEQDPDR